MKNLIFCILILLFSCDYTFQNERKSAQPVKLDRTVLIMDTSKLEVNKAYLSQYSAELRKQMAEVKERYPLVAEYTSLLRMAQLQDNTRVRDLVETPVYVNIYCLLYELTGNYFFRQKCTFIDEIIIECGLPGDYFRIDKVFMGETVAEGVSMGDAIEKWSACMRGDNAMQPAN